MSGSDWQSRLDQVKPLLKLSIQCMRAKQSVRKMLTWLFFMQAARSSQLQSCRNDISVGALLISNRLIRAVFWSVPKHQRIKRFWPYNQLLVWGINVNCMKQWINCFSLWDFYIAFSSSLKVSGFPIDTVFHYLVLSHQFLVGSSAKSVLKIEPEIHFQLQAPSWVKKGFIQSSINSTTTDTVQYLAIFLICTFWRHQSR